MYLWAWGLRLAASSHQAEPCIHLQAGGFSESWRRTATHVLHLQSITV